MTDRTIRHPGPKTDRGYSDGMWGMCPREEIANNQSFGWCLSEDFCSVDTTVSSNVGRLIMNSGGWRSYEDNSCTCLQNAKIGGQLELVTDGTDNTEVSVQAGGASGAPFVVQDTAGSNYPLWYETRLKISAVTATSNKWLAGLASEGAAAADLINDTGVDISDIDFIGFMVQEAAAVSTIDFIVQTTGGAFVKIIDTVSTPTADTFVKLGFVWTGRTLTVYVDDVANATKISGSGSAWTYGTSSTALTALPDGQELSPIFGMKNAVGTAHTLTVDWVDVFQLGYAN